tara:strand:- start:4629 stop:5552 length:924 start_codon:yes stop_codon:yes gene_type:complete
MQRTLKKSFSFSGVCLHSGNDTSVTVHPAPANTGIKFKRTDLKTSSEEKIIDAVVENIIESQLCTSIQNKYGNKVSTIEHLMSALNGLGIDNALVDVDSDEVPILDGSSKIFVDLIDEAGIKNLRTSRKIVKILRPIIVGNKDVYIKATPAESFKVDYTISYDHILLDHQRLTLDYFDENIYRELISNSRTFGFKDDVDMLLEKGLIKGGSLNNAVLLDEKGIVNEEELRYPDEFVRHKILDFIGDIFLLGKKVEGHFEIFCGGHSLTQELLKTLMSDKLNWKLMDENPSHIDKRSIESRTEISAAI